MYVIFDRITNRIEGFSFEYPSLKIQQEKNFIKETVIPADWFENWNKGKYRINIEKRIVEAVPDWTPPVPPTLS